MLLISLLPLIMSPNIFTLHFLPYSGPKTAPAIRGSRIRHTILNNLHAGSLGCAPTPSQYFALAESSLISFQRLPSPSIGALGIGSYVPVFISLHPHHRPLCLLDPNYSVDRLLILREKSGRLTKNLNRFAVPRCPVDLLVELA
jgi:hypothetical protein